VTPRAATNAPAAVTVDTEPALDMFEVFDRRGVSIGLKLGRLVPRQAR
jgi:hypothetical protein